MSLLDEQGNTAYTTSLGNTTSMLNVQVSLPSVACNLSPTKAPSTSSSCSDIRQIKIQSTTSGMIQMLEVLALSSGVNVALNKAATQSSTYSSRTVASNAVDNNDSSFSHTSVFDTDAWWMVDLQEDFTIDSLTIINRYCQSASDPSNCLGRLSDAAVFFVDQQGAVRYSTSLGNTTSKHVITILPVCSSSSSSTPFPTKSPTGSSPSSCTDIKQIKIQSTTGGMIQMLEVQALSSGVNVALNKAATQSSTYSSRTFASNAVDGNDSSFSHTSVSDTDAWWMVDLQEDFTIDSLKIMNRYCQSASDPSNCLGRLSDAAVSFVDQQGAVRYSTSLGNTTSKHVITILPVCSSSSSTPTPAPSKEPTAVPTKMPTKSPIATQKPTNAPTSSEISFGSLSNWDTYCVVPNATSC
jgi:molybdopterin/thiamine biosynthesis adenylyltransferase